MSEPGFVPDGSFDVSSAIDSLRLDPGNQGANAARAAAVSTLLLVPGTPLAGLTVVLGELGFTERLLRAQGGVGQDNLFTDLRLDSFDDDPDEARRRAWIGLNESARPRDGLAFLLAILRSPLERESTVAAAALWRVLLTLGPLPPRRPDRWFLYDELFDLFDDDPFDPTWPTRLWPEGPPVDEPYFLPWDPERWDEIFRRALRRRPGGAYADRYLIALLVRWRLGRALRSPDPITRSLAMAAFEPEGGSDPGGQPPLVRLPNTPPGALVVSTMIHGTWAWKGDWWRPRGGFHEFILRAHRPNLYSRGAKFSWSGSLRDGHRGQAAIDFIEWAYDVAPNGLQTVFGHSYGGEVAARALLAGARMQELVLLSTPTTPHVIAAASGSARVIDVRLRFDLVLGIAGRGQRLPTLPNVTEVRLSRWWWDHGATHEEHVWRAEDVAARANL